MGFFKKVKKLKKKATGAFHSVTDTASHAVSAIPDVARGAVATAKTLSKSPALAAIGPLAPGILVSQSGALPGIFESARPLLTGAADVAEKLPYLSKEGRKNVAIIHGPRVLAAGAFLFPALAPAIVPAMQLGASLFGNVPVLGDFFMPEGAPPAGDGFFGGTGSGAPPVQIGDETIHPLPGWLIVLGVVAGAGIIYFAARKK